MIQRSKGRKLIRVALWTGILAFPLLVVSSMDATLGTDTKGCWYVENKLCGMPPERKCTSQFCEVSHHVENLIDTNGDGDAEATEMTPGYECNGKIGYYNIGESFPVCSFVNIEVEKDHLDEFVDSFGETFEDMAPPENQWAKSPIESRLRLDSKCFGVFRVPWVLGIGFLHRPLGAERY